MTISFTFINAKVVYNKKCSAIINLRQKPQGTLYFIGTVVKYIFCPESVVYIGDFK